MPLLTDLKAMIVEQLSSGNLTNALTAANEILDLDHLKLRLDRNQLDLLELLQIFVLIHHWDYG